MSFDEFKNDVEQWILKWVSVYNEDLDSVPCPYARNALTGNKIKWVFVDNTVSLIDELDKLKNGLEKEVVVIGLPPSIISADNLYKLVMDYNLNILKEHDVAILEDHPDFVETINGVKMNQGKWALLLIQTASGLNRASDILVKNGYYKTWSKQEMHDMIHWRKNNKKDN